jgi:hypothetical protein
MMLRDCASLIVLIDARRDDSGCRDALTQCRRTKKSHGQQDQNGERQEQRQERTVRDHENTQPPLPP